MRKQLLKFNPFKKPAMALCTALIGIATLSSCERNDEDNEEDEGEELITTVELTFTDSLNNDTRVYFWRDNDGPGGMDPEIDQIVLEDSTNYGLSLRFLNESIIPNEDITEEIRDEGIDHLVCFTNTAGLVITKVDEDDNGLKLGLKSTFDTDSAFTGNINVILRHQPGVKDGTCDPGDTDIDVTLPITIN